MNIVTFQASGDRIRLRLSQSCGRAVHVLAFAEST